MFQNPRASEMIVDAKEAAPLLSTPGDILMYKLPGLNQR